jgi:tetratricopeptide (TPR) repeat protein
MNARMHHVRIVFLTVAATLAQTLSSQTNERTRQEAMVRATQVESLRLGAVDFPTSGAAEAQPHFIYGVAALHSFWYEEALAAFARAVEIDPNFAMALWGEAMCYYRSYRPGSDTEAGRRAIAKVKKTSSLTQRERAYIEAVQTLYGESGATKNEDYAEAMKSVHRKHPNDREAAAFYALALLGTRTKANKEKAGKLAEEVYRTNPDHPGAAHYIIHSYDDPANASRALHAAHQYARIAPDAPHALHMPSHIFVQLGMWREAVSSNDLGWAASVDYVKRKGLTPPLRDYHNLHWLIYASLQEGRYAKARELVERFVQMRANGELASYSARYINSALAAYIIDTRSWERADTLFAPRIAADSAATAPPARDIELCGAAPNPTPPTTNSAATRSKDNDVPAFIRAFSAAATSGATSPAIASKLPKIRELQLTGLARAHAKDFPAALNALREAAGLEAKTSKPPGPPVEKPAHELLGEVLLQAGKPAEAAAQFKISLDRHPNRALSLIGRARAEAVAGDKPAARASYARLLEIWQQADADLPELREARDFLKATG